MYKINSHLPLFLESCYLSFLVYGFSITVIAIKHSDATIFQVLSKEDAETLNLCKKMMERGEWPPMMVVFDPVEGYVHLLA